MICGTPQLAWLAWGVDPVTVQAWMGHASIATTNLYLHYLGTRPTGPDWPVRTTGGEQGRMAGGSG